MKCEGPVVCRKRWRVQAMTPRAARARTKEVELATPDQRITRLLLAAWPFDGGRRRAFPEAAALLPLAWSVAAACRDPIWTRTRRPDETRQGTAGILCDAASRSRRPAAGAGSVCWLVRLAIRPSHAISRDPWAFPWERSLVVPGITLGADRIGAQRVTRTSASRSHGRNAGLVDVRVTSAARRSPLRYSSGAIPARSRRCSDS